MSVAATPPVGRIDRLFAARRGTGALMPFVTAGFPTLADTERLLPALSRAGADAIELGIPFSDPIADGPVIAESMHVALQRGATPEAIFELVRRVRPSIDIALLAMVSISIVQRMGADRFVDRAAESGFDGLIVPDLDLDEAAAVSEACGRRRIAFSLLVAPTSSPTRVRRICALCRGFVYVLARVGITGERNELPSDFAERIAQLRKETTLPLAVGFGVSTPEQVRRVNQTADAAIVGSALVRRMRDAANANEDAVAAAELFVRSLAGRRTEASSSSTSGSS